MYQLTLSAPIDGVTKIDFPLLRWGAYLQIFNRISLKESRKDRIKESVVALIELGEPKLTSGQIDQLSLDDFNQVNDLFSAMKYYDDEYKGGQFKLSSPIDVLDDGASIGKITGFTFEPKKMGELWDYIAISDPNDKTEYFIKNMGRHVGTTSEVKKEKHIPLMAMAASDILFIQDNIEGKSQGGSAGWKKLSE